MRPLIRAATTADLPALAHIEALCSAQAWSEAALAAQLAQPGSALFVASIYNELLGYAALSSAADEGELLNLAVLPQHRRAGLGPLLLARVIEEARNRALACLFLEVRAGNAPALALYARLGFLPVGLRKGYYQHPQEDALLMRLLLPSKE